MGKIIALTLSLFVLCCCSSSTERVRYYSLVLDAKPLKLPDEEVLKKQLILLDSVQLARFLRQPGLVIQRGDNELITANYHRWAEPLDELIGKFLLTRLNEKSQQFHFESSENYIPNVSSDKLKLTVDKFHATDRASVIISGRYWLTEIEDKTRIVTEFSISEKQTADGYLTTVVNLKLTLDKLADEILTTLNEINAKP